MRKNKRRASTDATKYHCNEHDSDTRSCKDIQSSGNCNYYTNNGEMLEQIEDDEFFELKGAEDNQFDLALKENLKSLSGFINRGNCGLKLNLDKANL